MKILLILVTLALCWKLYEAKKKPRPPYVKPTADPSKELLDSWDNPSPEFKEKIDLTVKEYGYWMALTKYVAPKAKLQPTYVTRFCQCKKPYSKRSLVSRVKRQDKSIEGPVKRREWRRMSVPMRKSFIQHFNNLAVKRKGEEKSRLQIFAIWHRKAESPGAHKGPAFLPWHREYLFRLENALRDDGYQYGLPYWDSGLEYDLPDPTESAIFTTQELGVSNGLLGAPFNKIRATGHCKRKKGDIVNRKATNDGKSRNGLLHREDVESLTQKDYAGFRKNLEGHHNGVHHWVGGHMLDLNCVGFEPLFYLHHCYIDYLWQQFRDKQSPEKRQDYPDDVDEDQAATSTMLPFDDKIVLDGMSTQYTDVYYSYDHVPKKCKTDANCNGPQKGNLLWCTGGKCQGKIREGGQCDSSLRKSDNQCHCAEKNKKPKCVNRKCRCN